MVFLHWHSEPREAALLAGLVARGAGRSQAIRRRGRRVELAREEAVSEASGEEQAVEDE